MLRRIQRLKTLLLVTAATVVIVAGALVGAVRLLDTAVPGYREQTAAWLSERIGQPLEIGAMDLSWTWDGPLLQFRDVVLQGQGGPRPAVNLRELAVHFGFWDLLRGQRQPDGLMLRGVELTLHRDEHGDWHLQGLAGGGGQDSGLRKAADWLGRVDRIELHDSRLRITLAGHTDEPLVADLSGHLRNRGPRHRLRVQADLPSDIGRQANLDLFVLGRLADWPRLRAYAYLHLDDLAGARLLRLAGIGDDTLRGGRTDAEFWGDWRDGGFAGARATMTTQGFELADSGQSLQSPLTLDLTLQAPGDDGGYPLRLDNLQSPYTGAHEPQGRLTLWPDSKRAEGTVSDLPAALAAEWLKLVAPERLAGITADGRLPALRVRYEDRDDWSLGGKFQALAITNPDHGLAAGTLHGVWELGPKAGRVALLETGEDAAAGKLAMDRYLRGTLPLQSVTGKIDWRQGDDGWRVNARGLHIQTVGVNLTGGGEVQLPADAQPTADLSFDFRSEDVTRALVHIPQDPELPNPKLRDWLPKAITAGRVTEGQLRLRGPLPAFPFPDDKGELRVTGRGEGFDLNYRPDWPPVRDAHGTVDLHNERLTVHAERGRILDVAVGPADAVVPDVRRPVLSVSGRVRGADAAKMFGIIPASPLAKRFGRLSEMLKVSGRAGLDLDLSIPLKRELGEPDANGVIHLAGVRLQHAALPEPIEKVTGDISFTLDGLRADNLSGQLAGLPLTASLAPAPGNTLSINAGVQVHLPADAAALRELGVPPLAADVARGRSRWRASLNVGTDGSVSDLVLQSDLAGLALDLPAPAGKQAKTAVPTTLTLAADRKRLRLQYAHRLGLDLRFGNGGIRRGDLSFGDDPPEPPDGTGWWVGGQTDLLDIDAWRQAIPAGDGPMPELRGADLHLGELRAVGQRLQDIAVRAQPLPDVGGWRAQLSGAGGSGTIRWLASPDRPRLDVQLAHLRLTPAPHTADAQDDDNTNEPFDPADLPVIDVTINDLSLAASDFGRLRLQTQALPDGLTLQRLALDQGVMTMQASGQWRRSQGHSQAALKGHLQGSGIAQLLKTMGYTANLSAAQANIEVELKVAPNPAGLAPDSLNGSLSLALSNGRLLTVEPGAGRVLGLVNFYALPRRLLLDFSDVVGKGMAFDTLTGDFRLESGNAYTDNLTIDSPSADIRITGRIGLAARDYDQRVVVTPQVSSAAAIAGTVLGGPAVGAAVWVAQKLLEKPLGDLTRVSYRLTGSWDDPQIEKPAASE